MALRVFIGTWWILLPASFLYQTCILRTHRVLSNRQRGFLLIICGSSGSGQGDVLAVSRSPGCLTTEQESVSSQNISQFSLVGKLKIKDERKKKSF